MQGIPPPRHTFEVSVSAYQYSSPSVCMFVCVCVCRDEKEKCAAMVTESQSWVTRLLNTHRSNWATSRGTLLKETDALLTLQQALAGGGLRSVVE